MSVQVGVLISSKRYQRLLEGSLEEFRNQVLEHERRFGVRLLVASPAKVDPDADRAIMAVATPCGWQEEMIHPLPHTYLNRLVGPARADARGLRNLSANIRLVLLNETNRWHRQMVVSILFENPKTRDFVCPAGPFTGWPAETGLYLLAPIHRSPRQGGFLLELDGGPRIRYTELRHGRAGTFFKHSPPEDFPDFEPLLMSRLPGKPVGPGGPAEWRSYLVRSESGAWEIVGGVAKRDLLRSGSRTCCWPVEEALSITFGQGARVRAEGLRQAALDVVDVLTRFVPGIAHCAVDFWMDRHGNPMLADLAGHFRTDWLARIGDTAARQYLQEFPVLFACLIDRKGGEQLHVDIGRAESYQQR